MKPEPPDLIFRQRTGRCFYANDRAESIASAFAAFKHDSQKIIVLPDVISKKQMRLILNRRREDVQITVVIEIGKDSSPAVRYRVDAGNTGYIGEFFRAQIQIKRIAFVAAKGKSLAEHQCILVGPQHAFVFFLFV